MGSAKIECILGSTTAVHNNPTHLDELGFDPEEGCSTFCLHRLQLLNDVIDFKMELNLAGNLNTSLRVQAAFRKQKHLEMR